MKSIDIVQRILDEAAHSIFDWTNLCVEVPDYLFESLARETGADVSTPVQMRQLYVPDMCFVADAGDVKHARVFVQNFPVHSAQIFRTAHERLAWLASVRANSEQKPGDFPPTAAPTSI